MTSISIKLVHFLVACAILSYAGQQQAAIKTRHLFTTNGKVANTRHLLQSITPQCKDAKLVAKGCTTCDSKTKYCSQCKQGYVLQFPKVNCLQQACCNMIPKLLPVRKVQIDIKKVTVVKSQDINLLVGAQDERLDMITIVVSKFDSSWGQGLLLKRNGRFTGIWRFTPNNINIKPNSVLEVRYTITDMYQKSASSKLQLVFKVNLPPVLGKRQYRLPTLTAGVTALYPVADLKRALQVSDPNGDPTTISQMTLRFKNRGDKLTYMASTKTWEYACDSTKQCAKSLGNELSVVVSDGVNSATGVFVQPVKPRPALKFSPAVVLTDEPSLATIDGFSLVPLEDKGFELIRVTMPSDLEPGEGFPADTIPVELPQEDGSVVTDAIEYYSDRDGTSIAEAQELPIALADVEPFQTLFGIMSTLVAGRVAAAPPNHTTNSVSQAVSPSPVLASTDQAVGVSSSLTQTDQPADLASTGQAVRPSSSGLTAAQAPKAPPGLTDTDQAAKGSSGLTETDQATTAPLGLTRAGEDTILASGDQDVSTSSSGLADSDQAANLTSYNQAVSTSAAGPTHNDQAVRTSPSDLSSNDQAVGMSLSGPTSNDQAVRTSPSDPSSNDQAVGTSVSGPTSNDQAVGTSPSSPTSNDQAAGTSVSGPTSNDQAVAMSPSSPTSNDQAAGTSLSGPTSNDQAVRTVSSGLSSTTIKPQAASCSSCMTDEYGTCYSGPNDPYGEDCDPTCTLDNDGECSIPGSDTAACTGCIIDDYGSCVPDGDGECAASCVADLDTGTICVDDGSSGGGGNELANELYAWLVPPVKTTAMGFWVTLGCKTAGNITVEFNVANDEDFDGLDSDKDYEDTDLEIDPRRDSTSGRRLLGQAGGSSSGSNMHGQQQRQRRRLLQDRTINGKGINTCYTDDDSVKSKRQVQVFSHDPTDNNSSGSGGESSSTGRSLLTRKESEKELNYCRFYKQVVRAQEIEFECAANTAQRIGVWFSAWVENSSGYIRQVRVRSVVDLGQDPSMYFGGIVLSQTQPWIENDPLIKSTDRRKV